MRKSKWPVESVRSALKLKGPWEIYSNFLLAELRIRLKSVNSFHTYKLGRSNSMHTPLISMHRLLVTRRNFQFWKSNGQILEIKKSFPKSNGQDKNQNIPSWLILASRY